MAAYIFASVEITDPAAYEEYRKQVPAIIAAYGGRYLARGGAALLAIRQRAARSNLLAIEGV